MTTAAASRRASTQSRLLAAALDLFERQGYEQTSAAQIAAAAGVTEMTFFRHFPTKDQVLLDDPYDEALSQAVASRPRSEPALTRTVAALRLAWSFVPAAEVEVIRRRIRIVAGTPTLRGAVWRNNERTEDAVTKQLVADGCDELAARASAAAVLAALTVALLWWAVAEDADLTATISRALEILDA